jgi:hypothetical protein
MTSHAVKLKVIAGVPTSPSLSDVPSELVGAFKFRVDIEEGSVVRNILYCKRTGSGAEWPSSPKSRYAMSDFSGSHRENTTFPRKTGEPRTIASRINSMVLGSTFLA